MQVIELLSLQIENRRKLDGQRDARINSKERRTQKHQRNLKESNAFTQIIKNVEKENQMIDDHIKDLIQKQEQA